MVRLFEKTLIRVGNEEYARNERSFGLTTLRDGHVDVTGARCPSLSREERPEHEIELEDRRLARIV